jgi:hypothetical protein
MPVLKRVFAGRVIIWFNETHDMKNRRYYLFLIIVASFFTIGYLLFRPAFNYLSGYLSKSEHVTANVLIVEGWLPEYALKMAYKEYQENGYDYIVTTGMKSLAPFFNVSSNGNLIFYTKNKYLKINEQGHHTIDIEAYSSLGGANRAHFNVFVNDSLLSDFLAERHTRKYRIVWEGNLNKVDSIYVQFDNDKWDKSGDRNLFVKEIIIDDKVNIPYLNNSVYAIINRNGEKRITNNINSNAELAKKQLISLGIDSSLITAVPAERVVINRTLTSALAFRDWLKLNNVEVKGINIISMGTHARRTWMTYNRILKEKYDIGIISLPEMGDQNFLFKRGLKTIRETLGIIYYWLILIPF